MPSQDQLNRIRPLAYSPEGAARRLGVSVRRIYTLIALGEIGSFKEGKRRLIPESELLRRMQVRMAEGD